MVDELVEIEKVEKGLPVIVTTTGLVISRMYPAAEIVAKEKPSVGVEAGLVSPVIVMMNVSLLLRLVAMKLYSLRELSATEQVGLRMLAGFPTACMATPAHIMAELLLLMRDWYLVGKVMRIPSVLVSLTMLVDTLNVYVTDVASWVDELN